MPDELMKFKFGDALFMKAIMFHVKANVKPIGDYPLKINMNKVPNKHKEFNIKCFDLDKFRKERTINNINKIDLE